MNLNQLADWMVHFKTICVFWRINLSHLLGGWWLTLFPLCGMVLCCWLGWFRTLGWFNDQNDLNALNDHNGPFVYTMASFQIFIIRAIVGAGLAMLIVRMFYGKVHVVYAAGLAVFMVGMAYVMEYFRKKRENRWISPRSHRERQLFLFRLSPEKRNTWETNISQSAQRTQRRTMLFFSGYAGNKIGFNSAISIDAGERQKVLALQPPRL